MCMLYILRAHEEYAQRSLVRRVTRRGDIEHATRGAPKWDCYCTRCRAPRCAFTCARYIYTICAHGCGCVFVYVYQHMPAYSYIWCICVFMCMCVYMTFTHVCSWGHRIVRTCMNLHMCRCTLVHWWADVHMYADVQKQTYPCIHYCMNIGSHET